MRRSLVKRVPPSKELEPERSGIPRRSCRGLAARVNSARFFLFGECLRACAISNVTCYRTYNTYERIYSYVKPIVFRIVVLRWK